VVFLEKERNIQLHSSSRRRKEKANFTKRASASTDFDFYYSLRKSRQEVAL
jgi:hypothetical protein